MKMRIKEARERAGYTQTELAARIGVAPNTFNGYENGLHDPKSKMLRLIASECNTSIDYLLCLTDDPTSPNSETKKSPAPESAEAINKEQSDRLYSALVASGLIVEDDLVAEDIRFLGCVVDLVIDWFDRKKTE